MPTLEWLGKSAVVEHHNEVPFHLLRCDEVLSVGDPGSGNLLIQADNLLALKALLPYYAGKVKCIFIDPPYNTGNESWVYNDNVNSPEIQTWLGQVVRREAEDLSRHDKWLCMMYPRLVLLRELLRSDGAIFISIDDVEAGNLRLIMDEIFGRRNLIANFVWQSKDTPGNNASGVAETHNHVLAYRRSDEFRLNLQVRGDSQIENYSNPDDDPRGDWLAAPLTRVEHRDRDYYPLTNKGGREVWPPRGSSWRRPPRTMKWLEEDDRIWWGKDGDSSFPMEKKFLSEAKEGIVNRTWWPYEFAGSTRNASAEIKQLFGGEKKFDTPKPLKLLQVILRMTVADDSLVLDSFAGSGTTGHAVLQLNKEDGGNRRFILVEMESTIAQNIAAERLKRAIVGYQWTGQRGRIKAVDGLGGGFRFCILGEPLFDADGHIQSQVTYADLARHVFFTETGVPLPQAEPLTPPLLGLHGGMAVYLLFNGVLGDIRPNGGNVLTRKVLDALPPHDGPKVIYGEGCLLGPTALHAAQITFRQVPYDVKVS